MENPIKMDDLGVPLFLETPISTYHVHRRGTFLCHQPMASSMKMILAKKLQALFGFLCHSVLREKERSLIHQLARV